ncbi:MAG TPA: hypothetical protein VMF08_09270 [Candidatus Sulfotelmatobacter sp.]|nr:hypothetical protein [Candidatus Sulfotelmatobacter sp.]
MKNQSDEKYRMKPCFSFWTCVVMAIIAFWSLTFRAQADCDVYLGPAMYAQDTNEYWAISGETNVDCGAGQDTESQFIESSNAVFGYLWFSRVVNTNGVVCDRSYLAGTANAEPSIGAGPADTFAYVSGIIDVSEDVLVQFVPTTNDETPPASISFQACYNVQGQISGQYDPQQGIDFSGEFLVSDVQPFTISIAGGGPLLYTTARTFTISTNVLGSAMSGWSIGRAQSLELYHLNASDGPEYPEFVVTNDYGDGYYVNYGPATSYNVSCSFLYFTNIVDQSNNPVSITNLIFYCVDPNDTSNLWYTLGRPGPHSTPLPPYTIEPPPMLTLQAYPSGNSLIIQWPLYASNFQLQKACNLTTGEWTTNCLPAPVQVGPFLQVTVPMTNSCAFFRLVPPD